MSTVAAEKPRLNPVFKWAIIGKGVLGVFELLGAIALLFASTDRVRGFIGTFTAHEIANDEYSPIWRWFDQLAATIDVHATLFAAIYLGLQGIIKLALVWAVLTGRVWAYPWVMLLLLAMIAYQVFDMTHKFTPIMLALTIFDVCILALTFHGWRVEKRALEASRV